jgi:hypothetical protein
MTFQKNCAQHHWNSKTASQRVLGKITRKTTNTHGNLSLWKALNYQETFPEMEFRFETSLIAKHPG